MSKRLEELPGYNGVFGEVVTADCYRLRELDFVPDVVLDLGANVGCFARHARSLFPQARIICVEPDDENFHYLNKFSPGGDVELIQAAIGRGNTWEHLNRPDGSHGCFLSDGLGYPPGGLAARNGREVAAARVPTLQLSELVAGRVGSDDRVVLKIDIEGNEHTIFTDEASMDFLRRCDYLTIEVHKYALTAELIDEVRRQTDVALDSLAATHDCDWQHVVFFARKRS